MIASLWAHRLFNLRQDATAAFDPTKDSKADTQTPSPGAGVKMETRQVETPSVTVTNGQANAQ